MAAGAFLGSLTALAAGAVKVASSFEQNRISFETMLGSADRAKRMMADLAKFTLETPFEMSQVTEGAKKLLAYGTAADDIIPTFKMLGDIAAGVGMEKLPNLTLAFGQVQAATRLTGMELRQFTEAGVPLLDMLSEQMQKPVSAIKDMVSAGEVGFEDVRKALASLAGEGGKFENMMLKQSKSFSGLMSNIKDKISQAMSEIAGVSVATGEIREGSLFAVLKEAAEKLYAILNVVTPKLVEFSNWFAQNQAALAITAGIIGSLLVLALVALVSALSTALVLMGTFAAAGAAIGAVAYLIYQAWTTNFLGIQDAVKVWSEFFISAWGWVKVAIENVTNWLTSTALPAIQAFFTFTYNLLMYFVAVWQFGWAVIKTVALTVFNWFWDWAGPTIMAFFDMVISYLQSWVAGWKLRFDLIVAIVKEVTGWFMTYVYPTLQSAFNSIASAVNWLWKQFEERFNWIKEKVESVISFIRNLIDNFKPKIDIGINLPDIEGAWNNLKTRARAIGVPGFQTGGIVPGPVGAPALAMVHGGERISPTGLGGGNTGGGGVTFNVSIGLYAGTETEKRNIARDLYSALLQVAQSQNKTVAQLMNG